MTLFVVRDERAHVLALQSTVPPAIEWVNAADAYRRMDEIDATLDPDAPERDRPATYLPHIPAPKLRIDAPEFALNAFFLGLWFVSARMRAALDLGAEDVLYREADVTGASRASAMGYAAMAPVHHAVGIDPDRSDIERFGDGDGPTSYWQLATDRAGPPKVTLRPGFAAPAPLFAMDRTDWLVITADVAARVRAARIVDVHFDDPFPAYGSWMDAGR